MSNKRFSTFEGVFTPTILSILGVIMFLRLGWVVGTVGLWRALLIISIANIITLLTSLSISSITTNIRIGTGGAYSIISKSLGYEVGGAIGIPLYLSQAISVAFYITGFSECWAWLFPQHSFMLVSLSAWLVLLIISYSSARLAFRLQYVIMVAVASAIISFLSGKIFTPEPVLVVHGLQQVSFWKVFAIFFPAVTGILAGVSMSGELKEPEKNIPKGILSAVAIGFFIYVVFAVKFAFAASAKELVDNSAIVLDLGRWRIPILAGIMGAIISSALSMFVTAPRTLLALSRHKILPLSKNFAFINKKQEPTTAILFTAFLALITIALGTLNSIAVLLTMFFLITYGAINIAVFIENNIGIISFRPAFRIPLFFSFFGGLGCIIAMFYINTLFSVIALFTVMGIYLLLLRRAITRNWPDVRKGLFIYIAEQCVKIASRLPYHPKIWKPNLLIPIETPKNLLGMLDFLKSLVSPSGRISFFRIVESLDEKRRSRKQEYEEIGKDFALISDPLKEEGLLVTSTIVDSDSFFHGASAVAQTLRTSLFPPNVLFIKLGLTDKRDEYLKSLIYDMTTNDMGVMVFFLHPQLGLSQQKQINLWVREGSPNIDLATLIALQLQKNWEGQIRLVQAVNTEEERAKAVEYFTKLKDLARMPKDTNIRILLGSFQDVVSDAPLADINIFGMPEEISMSRKRMIAKKINTSVLFLRDSKHESVIV